MYVFIRRRLHTRIKSNSFETIRVCKIPWMILHNDTRIKSYTYEKLHVWKVTRMKNYTYEKLLVLNIELWLVHCYTRIDSFTELLIRVCFLTWNFSYVEPLPLFVHFGQPYTKASDAELWCLFDLRLKKRLSRQSCGWWFETSSRSLWRHCNETSEAYIH